MNRHQLATLISWAGSRGLSGRKRLQGIVYILQWMGCDLGCHYRLLPNGPYSLDVASVCDEATAAGVIREVTDKLIYKLSPKSAKYVRGEPEPQIQRFRSIGKMLLNAEAHHVNCAFILLFFHQQGCDWDGAIKVARAFKIQQDAATLQFVKSLIARASKVRRVRRNKKIARQRCRVLFRTFVAPSNQGRVVDLETRTVVVTTGPRLMTRSDGCASDELVCRTVSTVTLRRRIFVVDDMERCTFAKVTVPYGFTLPPRKRKRQTTAQ